MTRYTCCDDLRRNAVRAHPTLNGIDILEVLDREAPAGSPRQRTVLVRCLKPVPALTPEHVAIAGGERIRDVGIEWVTSAGAPAPGLLSPAEVAFVAALPEADHVLLVRTASAGDDSPYRLSLRRSPVDPRAPVGFDPRLAEVPFSFKIECPTDFDCAPAAACSAPEEPAPEINYLAKDYQTFRRLMLDRMRQLAPGWQTRNPADVGVTLVELLAYAGDQLSYWQDAVATEAYLGTARQRRSLRRHATLVDYAVDDGGNARTWVQLQLAEGVPTAVVSLERVQLLSRVSGLPGRLPADPDDRRTREAFAARPIVFEPIDPTGARRLTSTSQITLTAAHHQMPFHTWGNRRCSLPLGATAATLAGHYGALAVGEVLVFEEVVGPRTGEIADADPGRRHAVRLTAVRCLDPDAADGVLVDPLPSPPVPITEIAWAPDDGLPFALCLSARTDEAHGAEFIDEVSVARGNILLADHGRTCDETLPAVEAPTRFRPAANAGGCAPGSPIPIPVRYRPSLSQRPLTHAATAEVRVVTSGRRERLACDPEAPASRVFAWQPADVLPAVWVTTTMDAGGTAVTGDWVARRDLLSSDAGDRHFVVEVEHDLSATLRFGDDVHGRRPEPATAVTARYRVGQGVAGNVGQDALAHVVSDDVRLAGARNPLPARGGREPESAAQIRRRAPQAFRTQARAVTPADYADVTGRVPGVQRAAATERWTGSWHTMFVTVDRAAGVPMDAPMRRDVAAFVEPYRMAGHDLAVDAPIAVSLEIAITVCVEAGHFRRDVESGLLAVLGTRRLADGRRGLFHPDAFTFGQSVPLSAVYAAIRAVPGVETAEVTRFERQGQPDGGQALGRGEILIGRLEIARLDNDRNFPERGVLRLSLHGGK